MNCYLRYIKSFKILLEYGLKNYRTWNWSPFKTYYFENVLCICNSYFFKIYFSVSFEESSLQRCKLVQMFKPFGCSVQFCTLQLPISHTTVLAYNRHIFICFFQMKHIQLGSFPWVMRKIWSSPPLPRAPLLSPHFEKSGYTPEHVMPKFEKIRMSSFTLSLSFLLVQIKLAKTDRHSAQLPLR